MSEKRYFWFKMQDDFFNKKEIKKLRTIAGGDTHVIIYLKMILLSLKNGGKLFFERIDDDFDSEIALEIDESKDNVSITISYLLKNSILIEIDEHEYKMEVDGLIGSESSTATRVRRHREKNICDIQNKTLLCNTHVTAMKQNVNGELDIEIEIDTEKEIEKDSEYSEPARLITQKLYDNIMRHNLCPTYKKNPPKLKMWQIDIEKLLRIDGIKYDDAESVVIALPNNDFWRKNILSGKNFRKHFNRLYNDFGLGKNDCQKEDMKEKLKRMGIMK